MQITRPLHRFRRFAARLGWWLRPGICPETRHEMVTVDLSDERRWSR